MITADDLLPVPFDRSYQYYRYRDGLYAASSPWCVAPYFASVKERPVCLDMVEVLRTGKPANWASLRNEKDWAKAMESPVFAGQFTAAMDCRGAYLGPAVAQRLDCARYHHLLDVAGGSGIYSCALVARHSHLRATILEKAPVDPLARQALAERGFADRVSVVCGDMMRDPFPDACDIHLFSNVLRLGILSSSPLLAREFEFVVIGDTRPTFESENFRVFDTLIGKINTLKPALVINLGDLIYGYGPLSKERQWDKYQAVVRKIEQPYYQVPGNHDTHSREARKIYGRRFGRFYQSFDYAHCHFVLLDNTEAERWGQIGAGQLEWLKADLEKNQARSVFVFLHFPVWEPERVAPKYYDFWRQTLHPLFRQSRVRAVFAGHYHSYGPTREFDGIHYFITGGGGAELQPEYRRSGGEHHFLRVKVTDEDCQVRVVTERGELTDAEADVMGGLRFADKNSSRIGLRQATLAHLTNGVSFSVSLANPYPRYLVGKADWVFDSSAFTVNPTSFLLNIAPGGIARENFTLTALRSAATLQSLPRLEFSVVAGGRRHRFHRDVLILQERAVPYWRRAGTKSELFPDEAGVAALSFREGAKYGARLWATYDHENLYLSVSVPDAKADEEESAFSDDLQIGLAYRSGERDFTGDFLRLGFSRGLPEARNRTPGRNVESFIPGVRVTFRAAGTLTDFRVAIPLRLIRRSRNAALARLILNISFPVPEDANEGTTAGEPEANSFSYQVRYGSAALVPVHFVELALETNR